jgi:hypothetical protein
VLPSKPNAWLPGKAFKGKGQDKILNMVIFPYVYDTESRNFYMLLPKLRVVVLFCFFWGWRSKYFLMGIIKT